jgi:pimeloyl-ACP methyl ester carboxylesterase
MRLHYCEYGQRTLPPLICLHGFMGTAHSWDTFASRVSDRFHVLAPTARGHGDSARPEDYDDTLAPVSDAAAFMDALEVPAAIVMGHSMGALAAAGLAILHPNKVSKLIIGDAGPDSDPRFVEQLYRMACEWRHEFGSIEEVERYMGASFVDLPEDEVRRLAPYSVSHDPDGKYRSKLDPALVRRTVAQGPNVLPPGENPLWQFVPQIKCPT